MRKQPRIKEYVIFVYEKRQLIKLNKNDENKNYKNKIIMRRNLNNLRRSMKLSLVVFKNHEKE